MAKKKLVLAPKSKLGYNDKLKICYNCCFYGKDGYCPWEDKFKNYNDKCTIFLKGLPSTFFRYRFDLPYKIDDIIRK